MSHCPGVTDLKLLMGAFDRTNKRRVRHTLSCQSASSHLNFKQWKHAFYVYTQPSFGNDDFVFAMLIILKYQNTSLETKRELFSSFRRHCNVLPAVWAGQRQCHTGWQRRLIFQWNKKFHQQHRPEPGITGPLWGRVSLYVFVMCSFLSASLFSSSDLHLQS